MTIMLKKINTERAEDDVDESSSCILGLVAVVGSDGTGKSTLTADLVRNLQKQRVT